MQQEVQQEKIFVALRCSLGPIRCNKCNKKKSLLHLLLQVEKFGKRRKRLAQALHGVSVEGQIQGELFQNVQRLHR